MIPVGTTGRQLDTLARWLLAGLVVVAMGLWARPTLAGWGALTMGLLATLLLYLLSRTLLGDTRLLVHPVHLALGVPAAVLAWQIIHGRLWGQMGQGAVSGALNLSMLFHLWLFALMVLLSQSLLPKATRHVATLLIMGGAMMLTPFAVWSTHPEMFDPMRQSQVFLGLAGVCVWLSSLWGIGRGRSEETVDIQLRHIVSRWTVCLVAPIVLAGLAVLSPKSVALALTVMAAIALVGVATFHRPRVSLLLVLSLVVAGGTYLLSGDIRSHLVALPWRQFSLTGLGERGFYYTDAADMGLETLGWVLGYVGLAWLAAGTVGAGVWLFARSYKRRRGDQGRVVIWTCAAAMASLSLLAGGGLFAPAMTMAAGLTWGMYPQMINRNTRTVSGVVFLVVLLALAAAMALASRPGLATWGIAAVTRSPAADKWLHGGAGLVLGMTLAWLMGSRRMWLGVVGLALAALAGGQAEWLQMLLTRRNVDMRDWQAHLIGVTVAAGLYVLCILARGCESPDASTAIQRIEQEARYTPL
jgi:hypothetical protein